MRARLPAGCLLGVLLPLAGAACSGEAPAALPAPLVQEESGRRWLVQLLGCAGNVEARLRVRASASLADEDWLALEFENRGAPAEVRSAWYRIEAELRSPGGDPAGWCSLAQGGERDLFPEVSEAAQPRRLVLAPGRQTGGDQPGLASAGLLGLPPPGGWQVRAVLHLDLELADGSRLDLPAAGAPFVFAWQRPDAAGLARVRARLGAILADPGPETTGRYYFLAALLRAPELSGALSAAELLAALDCRPANSGERQALAARLAARPGDAAAARDFYLARLRAGDDRVLADLAGQPGLWAPEFVAPLVARHEAEGPPWRSLAVLDLHPDDWRNDHDATARLAAALLRAEGSLLRRRPEELGPRELQVWAAQAADLGRTRDPGALPLLRPFLACRAALGEGEPGPISVPDPEYMLRYPGRACDAALNAILVLQGGDLARAYREAGGVPRLPLGAGAEDWAAFWAGLGAARDRMIAKLQAER